MPAQKKSKLKARDKVEEKLLKKGTQKRKNGKVQAQLGPHLTSVHWLEVLKLDNLQALGFLYTFFIIYFLIKVKKIHKIYRTIIVIS